MTKARDNANNWAGDVTLTGAETLTNKTVAAADSSTKALIVKAAASQTANLQEWQNSSGTILAKIDYAGKIIGTSDFWLSGSVGYFNAAGNTNGTFISVATGRGNFVLQNASAVGLTVKGAASQTGNLQEWQNSAGTTLARVSSGGAFATSGVGVFGSQSPVNNSQLTVVNGNASYSAAIVKGAGSQTANLQEWQNSAGTVLASIGADGTLNAPLVTNAQVGTTYTLVLSDAGKMLEVNNASAITVTVPLNSSVAFPVGTQVNILQTGAGQITVAGAGGVTVNATPGLNLREQWSSATLIKRATDTWVLVGDLSA